MTFKLKKDYNVLADIEITKELGVFVFIPIKEYSKFILQNFEKRNEIVKLFSDIQQLGQTFWESIDIEKSFQNLVMLVNDVLGEVSNKLSLRVDID